MYTVYVNSYLEMYTTLYGWSLYSRIYDLLSISGVVYYPFAMALYHHWKKPYESQEGKAASVTSQRRMQVAVVSLLIVFSLAVLPIINLNVDDVTYHEVCSDDGAPVVHDHVSASDAEVTPYVNNLATSSSDTRIPAWWWLLLSFSSGINNAVSTTVPCFEDIKGLDNSLKSLTIKDSALREEVKRFANECFLESKARYSRALQGKEGKDFQTYVALRADALEDKNDPFYIGSTLYLETQGFYNWDYSSQSDCASFYRKCSFQAKAPVPGWPYVQARDVSMSQDDVARNVPGMPFCDEWWEDPYRGLKHKLLNSIEASQGNWEDYNYTESFLTNMKLLLENTYNYAFASDEEVERVIISRYFMKNSPPLLPGQAWSTEDVLQATGGGAAAVAGGAALATLLPASIPVIAMAAADKTADVAGDLASFYVTMFVMKRAAPLAQAVLLMMVYGLMIFYLVISEYDIEAVLLMSFFILALRFLSPLWQIADYLDASLFSSLYEWHEIGSILTEGFNRLLMDMVLTVNYLVVPMILFGLIGMAGRHVSLGNGTLTSMGNKMPTGGRTSSVPKPSALMTQYGRAKAGMSSKAGK